MLQTFITADLSLPTPPENHTWNIRNVVKIKKGKMRYLVKISLLDDDGDSVLTHYAKWDREREPLNDFLAVAKDEITRKLSDHISFMSINWENHNPQLSKQESSYTSYGTDKSKTVNKWV